MKPLNDKSPIATIMSIYKNDTIDNITNAIESILEQSYSNIHLYIQLDGPIHKDVDNYLNQLICNNIFIFCRDQNMGLAVSLNQLLNIILTKEYKYIARMDADDISMPSRFEKQFIFMESHPKVDCLGTWAIEIDEKGNEFYKKRMPLSHIDCRKMFQSRDCMIHPTVMFRKSYFEKAGLYPDDTYFGEDTMMWAAGFKNGCEFANLPEYLLKFRLDSNFFSRRRGLKHAKSILNLRIKVNKMLGFGLQSYVYAILYAFAKMMPKKILHIIYLRARN